VSHSEEPTTGIYIGGILMLLGLIPAVGVVVQALPATLRNALSSGSAAGGMCALLLNLVLPGERQ
jgi:xanthine/uracil permease